MSKEKKNDPDECYRVESNQGGRGKGDPFAYFACSSSISNVVVAGRWFVGIMGTFDSGGFTSLVEVAIGELLNFQKKI